MSLLVITLRVTVFLLLIADLSVVEAQTLPAGTRVRLSLSDREWKIDGRLLAADDSAFRLASSFDGTESRIARPLVRRIEISRGDRVVRPLGPALRIALPAAVVGGLLSAVICPRNPPDSSLPGPSFATCVVGGATVLALLVGDVRYLTTPTWRVEIWGEGPRPDQVTVAR